ncbi:MAG: hypothetical protein ACTSUK_00280, partial [Promethearchaeota archaeon]
DKAIAISKDSDVDTMINEPIGIDFQNIFTPSLYLTTYNLLRDILNRKGIKREIRYCMQELLVFFQQNKWENMFQKFQELLSQQDKEEKYHFFPDFAILFIIQNQIQNAEKYFNLKAFFSPINQASKIYSKKQSSNDVKTQLESFLIHFQRISQNPSNPPFSLKGNQFLYQIRTSIWWLMKELSEEMEDSTKTLLRHIERGEFSAAKEKIAQIYHEIYNQQNISQKFPYIKEELKENSQNVQILMILWFLNDILKKNDIISQDST